MARKYLFVSALFLLTNMIPIQPYMSVQNFRSKSAIKIRSVEIQRLFPSRLALASWKPSLSIVQVPWRLLLVSETESWPNWEGLLLGSVCLTLKWARRRSGNPVWLNLLLCVWPPWELSFDHYYVDGDFLFIVKTDFPADNLISIRLNPLNALKARAWWRHNW